MNVFSRKGYTWGCLRANSIFVVPMQCLHPAKASLLQWVLACCRRLHVQCTAVSPAGHWPNHGLWLVHTMSRDQILPSHWSTGHASCGNIITALLQAQIWRIEQLLNSQQLAALYSLTKSCKIRYFIFHRFTELQINLSLSR